MKWARVLEQVLALTYPALEQAETRWAVVGSVATVLQGCELMPGDIDVLAYRPAGAQRFAEALLAFTPPRCEAAGHDDWYSSREQLLSVGPDDYGIYWHFGRWFIEEVKVEIAHLTPPEGFPTAESGAGIWEGGPEIWPYVREVDFAGYRVPVVPLEIQLGTSLDRGLDARVAEIARVLRAAGHNAALIEKLRPQHRERFAALIGKEL